MDDKRFIVCLNIIKKLEEMGWTEYEFKAPFRAKAFDDNKYLITKVIYDESDHETDFDGALLVEVSTNHLNKTTMYIDGFDTATLEAILDAIPVAVIVRVTAHCGSNSFVVTEKEVDPNCIIEDWCAENFKGLDWIEDDQDQLVCYADNDNFFEDCYLLATLLHKAR